MEKTFYIIILFIAFYSLPSHAQIIDKDKFVVYSPDFKNGAKIPRIFTCQGKNFSPEIRWKNPPDETGSFVLIMEDPDVPHTVSPQFVWVHWILYNIPANARTIEKNSKINGLPEGTLIGKNSWHKAEYDGPCPPKGKHRYFFRLYALSERLHFRNIPDKKKLLQAMKGKIIAETEFYGVYTLDLNFPRKP